MIRDEYVKELKELYEKAKKEGSVMEAFTILQELKQYED